MNDLSPRRNDHVWFWLLLFIVTCFWALTWDTQPYLSSDDMGKDLYPFELALRGQWPCRDYYWQYGPMMLFYYPFWLALGGIHLVSIRMGYAVLYLLSSILCYRTLRLLVSPPVAFLASLSFLIQGMYYPTHNFNQVGALPFLLVSIFSLWNFFLSGKVRWGYVGTFGLVGMALVKWSVGLTSALAFFSSLLLFGTSLERKHFLWLPLILVTTVVMGYIFQYAGCPRSWWVAYYFGLNNPTLMKADPWLNFKHLIQWFLVWDQKRLGWLALFLVFGVLGFLGFRKGRWSQGQRRIFRSVLVSLLLFGVFNSADFFLLGPGQIYRLDFWSFPVLVLLMGLSAEGASFLFGRKTRMFLGGLIFVGVLALPFQAVREAFAARVPERYLDFPRGKVYLVKETLSTVAAIKKGTHFILQNTSPHQEILTVPKDPLYCFLSGRRHATAQLDFERSNTIPEWEEDEILHEVEAKGVPLVILSNRDESKAPSGLWSVGTFGKTHCKKLGQYLFEHYKEIQTFGTWETAKPRVFHAIKILQKND